MCYFAILNVHIGAGSVRKKLTSVCRHLVTPRQPAWMAQVSKMIWLSDFFLSKIPSHVSVLAAAVGHFVESGWIHVWSSRALGQLSAGQRGILHAASARRASWAPPAILRSCPTLPSSLAMRRRENLSWITFSLTVSANLWTSSPCASG